MGPWLATVALAFAPLNLQLAQQDRPAQRGEAAQPQQPAPTQPGDIELLPPEQKPDAAALAHQAQIERSISRRRTMLQIHQVAGFATLASLTAAVALGQANYLDKYGGGGDTGRFQTPHAIAAYSAAAIFASTGLLAILAPDPLPKPGRWDTARLHEIAMAVATAGYATQIVLGILTGSKEGSVSQRDFALAHQIIGYTTLAATATGFLVLTF
jgi:hypothetical protein